MFGLNGSELIGAVMGAVFGLMIFVFVNLGLFYVVVRIALRLLRSPRLVFLVLWFLIAAYGFIREVRTNGLNGPLGVPAALILLIAIISLLAVLQEFLWLWVMGWLWQRVGLSRLGTAWRTIAALHFRALTGGEKEAA